MPTLEQALLTQLMQLLEGGQAHATFEAAVEDFPTSLYATVPANLPYSAWQIIEHMRIAQHDILDFSTNPYYKPHPWPESYWLKDPAPPTPTAWQDCLDQIHADRAAFEALLKQADTAALITPFPWGDGQNLLREALLIADHNAYHTGELIILRRLLGAWK